MGNNNSVKRIAAALGWVIVFFGFFVCILYNIITIQYNLIFVNLGGPFVFYNLYFFCTDLTKKMGIVAKCLISLKMTPLKRRGCTSPSFSSPNFSGLLGHWH